VAQPRRDHLGPRAGTHHRHSDRHGHRHLGLIPGDWLDVDDALAAVDDDGKPVDDGWLYAVGDVNKRALLTHHGKYQARALGDAIAARAHGEKLDLGPWGRHAVTATNGRSHR
jgi:dihydrolipoamide dehydrogenase